MKTARWTPTTSLTDVIKYVVDHIDHPDFDNALRANESLL
jgi:hypothetical protein